MKKYLKIVALFFGLILQSQVDFNQVPNDDLGNFEDKFQEYFFEGLKQRGIENYQRSNDAFRKCLLFDDSQGAVFFEMGKNYTDLKNFGAAEDALKKAVRIDETNEWYLDALYAVYVAMDDFDKALKTAKQLVSFHPDYKEDLAILYFENEKYKAALKILDELNTEKGVSESRELLRNKIYNATGADDDRIAYLENQISQNPEIESNYLNLIFRYSEQGQKREAFSTAKRLIAKIPDSQLAHLALYKFYLDDNQAQEAINSMKIVVKSTKIEPEAKAKVLNDFVAFVKDNPQFEPDLLEVTTEIVEDDSGKSDEELGLYYLQNNNKTKALAFFKKALSKDPTNFKLLKNSLLVQIDLKKFNEAAILGKIGLENYPEQPVMYLINGVVQNQLGNPNDAISLLEEGVDYVFDNNLLEADFYKQLSFAYRAINNNTKAEAFATKAQSLIDQND